MRAFSLATHYVHVCTTHNTPVCGALRCSWTREYAAAVAAAAIFGADLELTGDGKRRD